MSSYSHFRVEMGWILQLWFSSILSTPSQHHQGRESTNGRACKESRIWLHMVSGKGCLSHLFDLVAYWEASSVPPFSINNITFKVPNCCIAECYTYMRFSKFKVFKQKQHVVLEIGSILIIAILKTIVGPHKTVWRCAFWVEIWTSFGNMNIHASIGIYTDVPVGWKQRLCFGKFNLGKHLWARPEYFYKSSRMAVFVNDLDWL